MTALDARNKNIVHKIQHNKVIELSSQSRILLNNIENTLKRPDKSENGEHREIQDAYLGEHDWGSLSYEKNVGEYSVCCPNIVSGNYHSHRFTNALQDLRKSIQ